VNINELDLTGVDTERLLLDLDRADCEQSLYQFYKMAWRFIDANPWKDSWAVDAICEHMQAVTDGEIKRLVINCPPRIGKSSLCSVAFPAWVWAQPYSSHTSGPTVPFLSLSYDIKLSMRDAVKCRRLIESNWYQSLWKDRFAILSDQNTKTRLGNDKGGERLVGSLSSGVTGEGGNIICFPADEVVATERGYITIGEIVEKRLQIRVWSFNFKTQKCELRPITGWFKNPASEIVRVTLNDGNSFRCTPNHHIWTERGYVEARRLESLDVLPRFSMLNCPNRLNRAAILFGVFAKQFFPFTNIAHRILVKMCIGVLCAAHIVIRFQSSIGTFDPDFGLPHGANRSSGNTVFFTKFNRIEVARKNILNGLFGKNRILHALTSGYHAMSDGVCRVFKRRSISQITNMVVVLVAITMARLRALRPFPDECQSNCAMSAEIDGPTVATQMIRPVSARTAPTNKHAKAAPRQIAVHAPVTRNEVMRESGKLSPLFVREAGHVGVTYCLEVGGTNNFHAGYCNTLVSNCIDDPNAANEVLSEAAIENVLEWWRTTLPSRPNDQEKSAIIVIQQRLAENDLTGHILETEKDGWVHLVLPARYEPERSFHTVIGWKDPRTEPNELLWPERLSEKSLISLETTMGKFVFAGQYQQRPEPKGGGIIRSDWWRLWEHDRYPPFDFILGVLDTAYTKDTTKDPSGMIIWGVYSNRRPQGPTAILDQERFHDGRLQGNRLQLNETYSEFAPRVMLAYAWDEHLELHELIEKVAKTCINFKVDLLVIENKAAGISVAQEIRRLYTREKFGVELFDPKSQDKTARLYSVQHLFAEGIITAPEKDWAQRVITQVGMFPAAKHDEYVDLTSMGLRKLRDMGLLVRQPEREAEIEESMQYRGQQQPLYPV
jgi:predicted phage terminase large subunit-like protein